MSREGFHRWVKTVGIFIAMLVGLATMGIVMPWDVSSKTEIDRQFAENTKEHTDFKVSFSSIETKLDIIIEELRNED